MTRGDVRILTWRFSVLALALLSFLCVSGALISALGDAYLRFFGGKAHAYVVRHIVTPTGQSVLTYEFVVDGRPHRFELSPLGDKRPLFDYLPQYPAIARPRGSEPFDLVVAGTFVLLGFGLAKASQEQRREGPNGETTPRSTQPPSR